MLMCVSTSSSVSSLASIQCVRDAVAAPLPSSCSTPTSRNEPGAGDLLTQDVEDDIGRSRLDIARVFPVNISATMEHAAWLIVHPSPSNEMAAMCGSIHLKIEGHDVTATGIAALLYDRWGCQRPVVPRALIVIQYEVDLCLAIHDAAPFPG